MDAANRAEPSYDGVNDGVAAALNFFVCAGGVEDSSRSSRLAGTNSGRSFNLGDNDENLLVMLCTEG